MAEEEISRVVAMAWGVAAAPQRGPKRELSHERIVEAAMEIADAEGLAAVTMQRVARSFGFTTMALYRYVSSKHDLHQLMLDASLGDGEWVIDGDDWRVGLEQWARAIAQAYSRHPWALDIPLSTESLLMPGQLRTVDAGMRAARTLPGGADDKLAVLMVLSVQVRGFAVMDRDMRTEASGGGEATRQLLRDIVAEGRFPDARPVIESGVYFSGVEAGVEGDDDFSTALELLMPGLERALEGREPVAQAAETELTPEAALADADAELASATALRKATQRRAGQLEKREGKLRAVRDAAKARAKEATKLTTKKAAADAARRTPGHPSP